MHAFSILTALSTLALGANAVAVKTMSKRQVPDDTIAVSLAGYGAGDCGETVTISFAMDIQYGDRDQCLAFPFGADSVVVSESLDNPECSVVVFSEADCGMLRPREFWIGVEDNVCTKIPDQYDTFRAVKITCA